MKSPMEGSVLNEDFFLCIITEFLRIDRNWKRQANVWEGLGGWEGSGRRYIVPSIPFPHLFPKLIATPINNIIQKKLA